MPSSNKGLVLSDELKAMINSALVDGWPILLAAVSAEGKPVVSFRGSLQTIGDDQFGLWARHREGPTLDAIRANPNVAMVYRSTTAPVIQFHGRARITEDEQERARVFDSAPERERATDPERKGAAVIIDLDRVEGVLRMDGSEPVRINMAR